MVDDKVTGMFLQFLARQVRAESFQRYENLLWDDVEFKGSFGERMSEGFEVMEDKPYFARAIVPVEVNGNHDADMYVLVIRDGEGTGAVSEKYPLDSVAIPELYQRFGAGAIPRDKGDTRIEVALPFLTMAADGRIARHVMDLEQVTLQEDTLIDECHLGDRNHDETFKFLGGSIFDAGEPVLFRTTWYEHDGVTRRGNPHAIINSLGVPNIQVVGFLATSETGKLHDLLYENSSEY